MLSVFAACAMSLAAQDYPPGQLKRLTVPTRTNAKPLSVSAMDIERIDEYPSTIHLKGNVEIRTPVCVNTGRDGVQQCAGYLVIHADEAELHEGTGRVETRGKVTVTREP
jgi:lipopolysaccharide export system protein LptA